MSITEATRVTFSDIKPQIGSVVHAEKDALLNGESAADIRDMLEQRGVLVFPEIHFNDEEMKQFTSSLGTLATELGGQLVSKISLDPNENATADYLKGAFFWHFDGAMSPMPILASLLASKVLPPEGGNTEFCNTYAAYDALSDDDKAMLADLRVVHAMAASQLFVDAQPTYEKWSEWLNIGRKELPLVWTHQSGRKSLVIGNTAHHVVGMDPLDGTDLLIRLRDWATRPEFVYSHEWKVGDLVMWDNTGTLHRALPYDVNSGRMLHRTKLEGEEPIA